MVNDHVADLTRDWGDAHSTQALASSATVGNGPYSGSRIMMGDWLESADATSLRRQVSRGSSRRQFLEQAGGGFGAVALAALLAQEQAGSGAIAANSSVGRSENPLAPRQPHFRARARRVIWLFMHGGPSHVDLFDPKPELTRLAGKSLPESFGSVMTRRKVAANPLLPAIKPFRPHGESGLEISDFLPLIGECADELCVLRGCHGDSVNHPQSVYQMNTGSVLTGRPSVGAWTAYGLGTENESLPAFVVLPDPGGGAKGGPPAWGSGYLPATFQGTTMRPGKTPILNLLGNFTLAGVWV